jgi:hypothetical protein
MVPIIEPVAPSRLKAELNGNLFLCDTSHGGFQVYLVDIESAPSVLTEIGRLRELAFRSNGGGTGKSVDLDRFDLDPSLGFKQIVLWDPAAQAIAGGYRILMGNNCRIAADGQPLMPSAHLFNFSEEFVKGFMPRTAELSRSFITSSFLQASDAVRNVFALDGLFEGICHAVKGTGMEYFFGKVTFYPTYPPEALSLISAMFAKHSADGLVKPHRPYPMLDLADEGTLLRHDTFKEDFRALKLEFRKRGYYIPPILNTYINLSSRFRFYGSAVNDEFGDVIEMGLLVAFADIQPERYKQLLVG